MPVILLTCLLLGVTLPLCAFAILSLPAMQWERLMIRRANLLRAGMRIRARHWSAADRSAIETENASSAPGIIATAAIAVSCALSLIVLLMWSGGESERGAWSQEVARRSWTWLHVGGVPIELGFKLDSLNVILYFMVTFCATCVNVFSLTYMNPDRDQRRYYAFLSLFSAAMLGLVFASNLLPLFVCWELVGLCSYVLIGHYFERPNAARAASAAFIVNRVGDAGLLAALGLCAAYLGTLSLDGVGAVFEAGAAQAGWINDARPAVTRAISEAAAGRAAALFQTSFAGISLATCLGLGFVCGAAGKSAQLPLHVWLPDAMVGPTPVSALIHAATMVAAGVILLARVFPMLTPDVLMFVASVGAVTLLGAALLACVQHDMKRVLAYSTISQLGLMMLALGIGAWSAALFHLVTHAFFKALLFLCAGAVLLATHHEHDIRRLGGLAQRLPQTAICFAVAALALCGAGLPWLGVGIGAYYSKDEILVVAMHRAFFDAGGASFAFSLLFAAAAIGAWLTPFYIGRCAVLVFLGKPRSAALVEHARESRSVLRPLLALTFLTLVSGIPLFFFRRLVVAAAPIAPALGGLADERGAALGAAHAIVPLLVGFAWVIGLFIAYLRYREGPLATDPLRLAGVRGGVLRALENRFYIDAAYEFLFVRGISAFSRFCRTVDERIVDGVPNALARAVERIARFTGFIADDRGVDGVVRSVGAGFWGLGGLFSRLQTGRVRNYISVGIAGIAAAIVGVALPNGYIASLIVVAAAWLNLRVWSASVDIPPPQGAA